MGFDIFFLQMYYFSILVIHSFLQFVTRIGVIMYLEIVTDERDVTYEICFK